MTYETNCTIPEELLEIISLQGMDFIPELIKIGINEAMKAERSNYLGAALYERSTERRGYANGYKAKTIKTRMGAIPLDGPQVRDGDFYPGALEKGQRSERALTIAFAEMYVQGVSTRKVTKIVEKLCGVEISSTQVSRSAKQLDEILEVWRQRPLGGYSVLYLDQSVRQAGQVRDAAVLMASGVNMSGKRQILGVSMALSEQDLLEIVEKIKPAVHIFGHIHESFGITSKGATTFINASCCDQLYNPVNHPLVFEYEI